MKVKVDSSLRERPVRRLLIIGNHLLGDSVATLHMIFSMKKHFHNTSFNLLTSSYSKTVYEKMGIFEKIVEYNKSEKELSGKFNKFSAFKMSRQMRSFNADLVIILPCNLSFAFAAFLAGIPRRLGFNLGLRSMFLTGYLPLSNVMPNEENYRSLLKCFPYHVRERYYYIKTGKYKNNLPKRYFVVCPGATHKQKEWHADNFKTVVNFLQREYSMRAVLIGFNRDRESMEMIAKSTGALNLAGKTSMDDAFSIINRSSFFLGNDSGMAHIAANMSVLTVVLLGPTDPVKGRPWGKKVVLIYNEHRRQNERDSAKKVKTRKNFKMSELSVNKVIDVLGSNRFFKRNLQVFKKKKS